MKVILATDHAGFRLKEKIKFFLVKSGYQIVDIGAHKLNKNDDYPIYMAAAATAVQKNPKSIRAIIFGGSGQGEAMVVNRFRGIRAAVFYGGPQKIITLSREHNNANILSLGARFVSEKEAKKVITLWLNTNFTNTLRHKRRIDQIERQKK